MESIILLRVLNTRQYIYGMVRRAHQYCQTKGQRHWSLYNCTKFSSNLPCWCIFCRFKSNIQNNKWKWLLSLYNHSLPALFLSIIPFSLSFPASLVPVYLYPPILALHFFFFYPRWYSSISHLLFPSRHPSSLLASKLQHQ